MKIGAIRLLSGAKRQVNRVQIVSFSEGDIRKGGGAFSKKEKAQEDKYFREKEHAEVVEYRKKLERESANKKINK